MTEKTSLYEAIGGKPAVERLTARFYALMDTLPEAKATRDIHPADLADSEEKPAEEPADEKPEGGGESDAEFWVAARQKGERRPS